MRFDSWTPLLVVGLLVAAVGSWGTWSAVEERRIAAATPQDCELAESLRCAREDERLVRLTDIDVRCDAIATVDGQVFAAATGPDGRAAMVEVLPGEACADVGQRGHTIDQTPPEQQGLFETAPGIRARGTRPTLWTLVLTSALAALGVWLVVVAFRTRRRLADELAQALALAAAPKRRKADDQPTSNAAPYRGTETEATLLPRPLGLRAASTRGARRKGIVLGFVAAVSLLATVGYVARGGGAQLAEAEVWEGATPTNVIGLSGEIRSRAMGVFQTIDVRYYYRDSTRAPHVGERSYFALFGEFAGERFAVRYDRDDPARHAISWSHEQAGPIWWWLLLVGALGVGASIAVLAAARRSSAAPRRWSAALEHPEEVELRVTAAVEVLHHGAPTGAIEYELAVPGTSQTIKRVIPRPQEEPFFLDLDRTRVLGVRNPKQPDAIIVLRCDLAPLDLDPALAAEIREQARARARAAKRTS